MKKYCLFLAALLSSCLIYSQNWSLFGSADTLHFNKSDIHSIIIDSSKTNGNKTVIYMNDVINDSLFGSTPFGAGFECATKHNIFGFALTISNDSTTIINEVGDSILFLLSSNKANSWIAYKRGNTILEATIDTITYDSTLGNMDSLKHITFNMKDTNGFVINHFINNKTLILSKSDGVINTINWFQFPNNSTAFLYKGKFERVEANLNVLKREFYNYTVGDVFHLREEDYDANIPPYSQPADFTNHKILTKRYSQNLDTVYYDIEIQRDHYWDSVVWFVGVYTIHNYSIDTVNIKIGNLNEKALEGIGYQAIIKDSIVGTTMSTISQTKISISTYNGRIKQTDVTDFSRIDDTSNWKITYGGIENKGAAIEGICAYNGYRDHNTFSQSYNIKYLIYFNKGNEIWGNPRLVTALENIADLKREEHLFYPNPTSNEIFISSFSKLNEIMLYDLKGRIIKRWGYTNGRIYLEEFNTGIYLLEFRYKSGAIKREKLILKR